jgi:anti-sigma B factor antagonist
MDTIPEPFAVTTRRSEDLLIITVTGELDGATADLLDPAIREAEKEDSVTIFVDLRGVSFIDSLGLNLLFEARSRCDRIRFVPSGHDQVARLIALTGADEVLGLPEQLE